MVPEIIRLHTVIANLHGSKSNKRDAVQNLDQHPDLLKKPGIQSALRSVYMHGDKEDRKIVKPAIERARINIEEIDLKTT